MASTKQRCKDCGANHKPGCKGCEHSFADIISAWQKSRLQKKESLVSYRAKAINAAARSISNDIESGLYDEGTW